jgi:hypothetical protein
MATPQYPQVVMSPDTPPDEYVPPDDPHCMDAETIIWAATLPKDVEGDLLEMRERARDFLGSSLTAQSADILAEMEAARKRRKKRDQAAARNRRYRERKAEKKDNKSKKRRKSRRR